MYVNTKTQVLLQTATIVLHGVGNPGRSLSIRAVLDCGSQRSYVSTRVQKELSLYTSLVEVVEITTFGSTKGNKELCNVVDIKKDGQTVDISALVVPYICEAVYRPRLPDNSVISLTWTLLMRGSVENQELLMY